MEWNREQNHLARRRRRHYLVHRGIPRFALSARWRSHSARAPAVRRRSARRAIHSSASINYPVGATRPPTCVRSVGPLEPGLGQRKSGLVPSKTTGAAVQVWANAAGARAGKARSVQRGRRYAMTVTDFKRRGSTVTTPVERSCRPLYFWNGTRRQVSQACVESNRFHMEIASLASSIVTAQGRCQARIRCGSCLL